MINARRGSTRSKSSQDSLSSVSLSSATDAGYSLRYKSALTCLTTLIANADKLLLVR